MKINRVFDTGAYMKQEKFRLDYQPPKFSISDVYLDFDLVPERTRVEAKLKIQRKGSHDEPLVLVGEKIDLESVEVNGTSAKFAKDEFSLTVFDVPDDFELRIVNYINPQANSEFEGLYMSDGAFCTQCEAEGFRKITYYLDRPDVSAKFTTRIQAPKDKYPYLLSNGNRTEAGDLENGMHYVVRTDPFSKPSYLFALVAGDFDVVQDHYVTKSGRDVELQLFVDKGNHDRGLWAMESIKNSMRWDEKRFGLEYDLDLFQVVAVDFFNMGAMENKGLNIFNSKYVLADRETGTDMDFINIESVIGHEYFHNWTGDRVTCRDWFQLSLKEGLTVFRDQEFSSDMGSRAVHRIQAVKVVRSAQFAEDEGPMAHPIRPDAVYEQNNFYTVTVYDKGAEVIRMIHTIIGEANFRRGLKLYLERFDGGCATCEDFVKAMEDASSADLSQFRNWYCQDGTPLVTAEEEYDASSKKLTIRFRQEFPSTVYRDRSSYKPTVIPLKLEFLGHDGRNLHVESECVKNGVYLLCKKECEEVFENVEQKPIVNYLGNFSAPIRLKRDYSPMELLTSISYTKDSFTRYDSLCRLQTAYFEEFVKNGDADESLLVKATDMLLKNDEIDKLFLAEILALPSESMIAEMLSGVIDVDAIHAAREKLRASLAAQLSKMWKKLYDENCDTGEFDHSAENVGKRAIAALCLNFIAAGSAEESSDIVRERYFAAGNMTDRLESLKVAVSFDLPCKKDIVDAYSAKFGHEGLLMDNLFRAIATVSSRDTLAKVKETMSNPSFTMSNPNRVRSLVGAFIMANPYAFHNPDGSGYAFAEEILTELNRINPQTASRIIEPLTKFARYDEMRQGMMKATLERLLALDSLAPDLYEKICRALKRSM